MISETKLLAKYKRKVDQAGKLRAYRGHTAGNNASIDAYQLAEILEYPSELVEEDIKKATSKYISEINRMM